MENSVSTYLTSAGVKLDQEQQLVFVNGELIKLPFLSFKVLQQLFLNAPDAISIDELINRCWTGQVVADETVVQRIALLRKVLSNAGIAEDCIENRRSEGYRWIFKVVDSPKASNKTRVSIALGLVFALVTGAVLMVVEPFRNDTAPLAFQFESLQRAHQYRQQFDRRSLHHAAELYSDLLVVQPENVPALAGLAMTLAHQVSKFEADESLLNAARQYAHYAIELEPDNAFVLQANGLVQDVSGDISGALQSYQNALKHSEGELSLYGDIAYLLTIRGDLVEAAEYHLRSLQGNHEFRYSQLALWYDFLGMTTNAEFWFRQAVLLNRHNLSEQLTYINWLIKQQRRQEAQRQLEQVDLPPKQSCLKYLYQAVLEIQRGVQVSPKHLLEYCREGRPEYFSALLWINKEIVMPPEQLSEEILKIAGKDWLWPNDYLMLALGDFALSGETYPEYLQQAVDKGYRDIQEFIFLIQSGLLPDNQPTSRVLKQLQLRRAETLKEVRAVSAFQQLQSITQNRQ